MPVVQWFAHVLRATFWLAINLAVVTALFLLSAHLGTQPGEDERHVSLFIRGVASLWLYIAAWTWVVRGVFKRPAPPAHKGKVTGKEAAKGSLGCLANLVPIPLVFIFVGRLADWAWAGIKGPDSSHPARQASEVVERNVLYAFNHFESWLPWAVAAIVVYNVVKAMFKARARGQGRNRGTASTTSGRTHVQGANEATLAKLRQKGNKPGRGMNRPAAERPILAQAGIPSAQTVGAAHAGAHGQPPRSASGPAHEDRVLGALRFSSSDGGWWAHREDGGFAVHLAGGAEGPEAPTLDLARQAVQRSFEVLLRASEAARPIAQSRGVGLPRFTIGALRVGAGSAPDVSLHLRCDADANHEYVVKSTDKLQTFKAG